MTILATIQGGWGLLGVVGGGATVAILLAVFSGRRLP